MTSTSSKIGFTKGVAVSIKIAAIYFLLGVLWYLLSDKILGMLVCYQALLSNVSIIKRLVLCFGDSLDALCANQPRRITDRAGGKRGRLSEAKYRKLVEPQTALS